MHSAEDMKDMTSRMIQTGIRVWLNGEGNLRFSGRKNVGTGGNDAKLIDGVREEVDEKNCEA